ncbi:AT-hook motif nuclear-localized protein 23-like protein, partial [Tanacetum coccineum]
MLLPWEFCAHLSSMFWPNGPATSHIVGLCILAIQDDATVRRMEEIDVDVLYEAWKRIDITKYVQIDGPPPKTNRASWFLSGLFK